MNLKKIGLTATVAGAMGAVALGIGAGTAQADHDEWWWGPEIPRVGDFVELPPPGHIGQITHVPPGQLKKVVPFAPPPGHWGW
ncbi:hypothetical protein AU195_04175 [Mycobacterium sp. IS-1496]|uniref:hypothetical protein n=1 Tax=Mycobacterium sp. IS-1496 TaxID=1772284 RepID=UPI00074179AA|nr:hypothetical protein [Mycobacterium sp. IS-1496]KUI26960.1 hypothetical protein AU195_04175 [Mycobacterium sp. IS-1496]